MQVCDVPTGAGDNEAGDQVGHGKGRADELSHEAALDRVELSSNRFTVRAEGTTWRPEKTARRRGEGERPLGPAWTLVRPYRLKGEEQRQSHSRR